MPCNSGFNRFSHNIYSIVVSALSHDVTFGITRNKLSMKSANLARDTGNQYCMLFIIFLTFDTNLKLNSEVLCATE